MTRDAKGADELRLLFLGYAVSDERMEQICVRDAAPPMQTHRFTWRMIKGIDRACGRPIEIASFAPVSDYPAYPQIVFRNRKWIREAGVSAQELPFLNVLGAKHLTRFVVALVRLLSWATRQRRERSLVLNYSVATSQMYACLLARWITSIKIVNVITDPPGVPTGKEKMVVRTLRRLDEALARFALVRFDGIIALTRDLEREFAPGLPCLIVEGAVDPCTPDPNSPTARDEERQEAPFIVTYAGSLAIESGVDNLIKGFAAMRESSARLWIFGRGSLATYVADAANADDRIEYFGFVGDDEMARRFNQSSVLVVPRPISERVSRFGFPSKLMEYIMASRPVAATEAAGIPREYFEHLFSLGSGTTGDITAGLERILATSPDERMRRASAAREFVCRSKNYILQGGRIMNFLHEVVEGNASVVRDGRHSGQ